MDRRRLQLDTKGLFWLPDDPKVKVAGTLTFDGADGGTLELIGSFNDSPRGPAQDDEPIRILGATGNKVVTLDDCLSTSRTFHIPGGVATQVFRPSLILLGAHFEAGEEIVYSAATIEMLHLVHWIGITGLSRTFGDRKAPLAGASVTLELPDPLVTRITSGELSLVYSGGTAGDLQELGGFVQDCHFRYVPPELTSIRDLFRIAGQLQNLVTLGTDEVAPVSLRIEHPDVTHVLPSGRAVNDPIEVYAALQGHGLPAAKDAKHPSQMLFTFEALGGVEPVGRWLDLADELAPVFGGMFAARYRPDTFMENRLQNVVFALETYHRLRYPNRVRPKAEFRRLVRELVSAVPAEHRRWLRQQLQYSNEPRLKQRLLDLAERAGEPFVQLVGDAEHWTEAVKSARNLSVHRDGRSKQELDGENMYYLSEACFFLLAMCLLRDCGAPDSTPVRMSEHQRFKWLAPRIRTVWSD